MLAIASALLATINVKGVFTATKRADDKQNADTHHDNKVCYSQALAMWPHCCSYLYMAAKTRQRAFQNNKNYLGWLRNEGVTIISSLRNMIYHHVFVEDEETRLESSQGPGDRFIDR